MQINAINPSQNAKSGNEGAYTTPPTANDVQAFNSSMQGSESSKACPSCDSGQKGGALNDSQLMQKLIALLQQLVQALQGTDAGSSKNLTHGGSTSNGQGGVTPVSGSGSGGSAGADELIPKPTEYLQSLNLGGKQVTVGGDGTASADEVAATAGNIQQLYDSSPTFRNMIDSSSDPSFEVSVGKRSDNTSWGNTQGRVFMNLNNVSPDGGDTFQSLLGHEFAHASIDLGHGAAMEQTQNAVAAEA